MTEKLINRQLLEALANRLEEQGFEVRRYFISDYWFIKIDLRKRFIKSEDREEFIALVIDDNLNIKLTLSSSLSIWTFKDLGDFHHFCWDLIKALQIIREYIKP